MYTCRIGVRVFGKRRRRVGEEAHKRDAFLSRLRENPAAVFGQNPFADGQSKPAAGSVAAAPIRSVFVKDGLQVLGTHAHSVIGYFQPISIRRMPLLSPPLGPKAALRDGGGPPLPKIRGSANFDI